MRILIVIEWIHGRSSAAIVWTFSLLLVSLSITPGRLFAEESGFSLENVDGGLRLTYGDQELLVYHLSSQSPPEGIDPINERSGFIHPIRTLSGETITGCFPEDHPHHYGLWSAWTRTQMDGRSVDYWNTFARQGYVEHRSLLKLDLEGPSFEVELAYVDISSGSPRDVLFEVWKVCGLRITPNGWSFDLLVRQRVAEEPVQIERHRYGGLAFRFPEVWNSTDLGSPEDRQLEVTTDSGADRIQGDQRPARWVRASGVIGGRKVSLVAMVHPGSFRYPQPLRIHDKNPYFVWTPSNASSFEISREIPYRAGYRFHVCDGEVTSEWIELDFLTLQDLSVP